MPFDIQYGPIGAAVQLGYRAGQGQYNQQKFGDDMQFMSSLNDQQRTADASRANDMQNALGYYQANAHNNLANAQLQQAASFHGAELAIQKQHLALQGQQAGALNNYRGGILDNRNANTDLRGQALGDREAATQQKNDAIGQLPPDVATYIKATGHAPPTLDHATDFVARSKELQVLQQQAAALARQKQQVATEEVNPITKVKTGKVIPRPGQEQAYRQWLSDTARTQGQLQQQSQEMQGFLQGKILPRTMQINPQQQQQTAAAASGGTGGMQQQQQQPQLPPPQFAPDGRIIPGSRGPLPPDVAVQYLLRVGGRPGAVDPQHLAQAKEAAMSEGWDARSF